MARTFTVKGRIEAEDAASGTISGISQEFQDLTSNGLVPGIAAFASLTAAAFAAEKALSAAVSAANRQEDATVGLASALKLAGPAAQAQAAALEEQATALDKVTRSSRSTIESAQALLATFGVQASQLKEATQAALDLSARLGIDLDTAAREVGGTIQGFTRGLDKVVPGLNAMSDAALKAGKGVTLIADTMKGGAIEAADTFSGKMDIAAHSAENFGAAVGRATEQVTLWKIVTGVGAEVADFFTDKINKLFPPATAAAKAIGDIAIAVTLLTEAEARNARIGTDVGNGISTLAGIANEFGISLESNLNAQLENNRLKTLAVEEAVRLGSGTYRDQIVLLQALKTQHDQLVQSLTNLSGATEANVTEQLRFKNAVNGTTEALVSQLTLLEQVNAENARRAQNSNFTTGLQFGGADPFGGGGSFTNIDGSARRF